MTRPSAVVLWDRADRTRNRPVDRGSLVSRRRFDAMIITALGDDAPGADW